MADRWPRGLSEKEAAAYVGVGVTLFRSEVSKGMWHKPHKRGNGKKRPGRVVWDKRQLDVEFDRNFGTGASSRKGFVRERMGHVDEAQERQ